MQNDIDAALDALRAHKPGQRALITRIQGETGPRYWQAMTDDVWFIGAGTTPAEAVADYIRRDRDTLKGRKDKLREELAALEKQEATL